MENKKTILVIGGAGVFGSRVCAALADRGWQPVVFDDLSQGDGERVKFGPLVKVDARETPRVIRTLMEYKITDIIHCGLLRELPGMDPGLLYEQHLKTTLSLLLALKDNSGRSLHVVAESPRTIGMLTQILADASKAYGFRTEITASKPDAEVMARIFSTLD